MSELARLRWLCRRGMKELDVVMSGFLENDYSEASVQDQSHFQTLLSMQDPDLYDLLLGREPAQDPELANFLLLLRNRRIKSFEAD